MVARDRATAKPITREGGRAWAWLVLSGLAATLVIDCDCSEAGSAAPCRSAQ